MNERIRELAKQCTSWSEGSTWTSREIFDKEKFAELIIRKCISQIALIGISNFENEDISWTVETAIANIKEHFGIKNEIS